MATKRSGARRGATKKSSRGARKGASKSRGGARGGARKAGARGATKRRGARKGATKRVPNPSFMKPMQPDEQLAAVVGNRPMPRTEITKRLWDYIRKNGLQDQQQRRMINADDNLRQVFGGRRQVSMFDMTKLVNQHMRPA
jgi:upstream activation factor subunit UAF30